MHANQNFSCTVEERYIIVCVVVVVDLRRAVRVGIARKVRLVSSRHRYRTGCLYRHPLYCRSRHPWTGDLHFIVTKP